MLYTSGTTGRPKGVYRSRTASATIRTIPVYGYRPGHDVHLCSGPLYHAAPLAFSLAVPLLCGVTVVLMAAWDAAETLRLVERHRITHTHLVPTMFHRLLSLPPEVRSRYDLSSLRFVVHGASPSPVPVKQALMEWMGPIVYEYYAATEGTGSWVDPQTWLSHPGTVGRPVDRDGLRVCDAGGAPLPAGEIGLVFLKAPEVGRFEYFKDSHKTAEAYRGDYFTLGDMGYKDDDGFLYLTDRSANLIISGGVNIYPAEVDAVLLTHPAVGDAATIGVPHPEWGEEVKAVVEVQPGVAPGDELAVELIEHCRARLAHFKCPRSVDFVDELPRQDNGEDVADWEGAHRLVQSAVDTFGGIDVLVNNAGILRDRMLVNMTGEEWDAVIRVHLRGTFAPSRWAAAHWRARVKAGETNDARIINTSSTSGIFGNPGQTNYGAAKAGIAGFTVILAQELSRYGVTVNAIAPGARTRMTENLGAGLAEVKAGEFDRRAPENVSPVVVWLGSPASREITGRVFLVSGGTIGVAEGWRGGPTVAKGERW